MHWNGYWAGVGGTGGVHGSLRRCHAVAQCVVGSSSSDVSCDVQPKDRGFRLGNHV